MIQKKKTNKENINAVNVNSKARNWALESKLGPPLPPCAMLLTSVSSIQ